MDVSFINPFISATIDCFKKMIYTEVTPRSPSLKNEPYPTYDISGVIGLSGEAQGSISLSFPQDVAIKVISSMLSAQINDKSPELIDGIGEIANIVAGNAKRGLSKYNLSISLPNVILGRNHIIGSQSGVPTIIVPFTSSLGFFSMEVALKTK
jgi:chemotaxis protein CheX